MRNCSTNVLCNTHEILWVDCDGAVITLDDSGLFKGRAGGARGSAYRQMVRHCLQHDCLPPLSSSGGEERLPDTGSLKALHKQHGSEQYQQIQPVYSYISWGWLLPAQMNSFKQYGVCVLLQQMDSLL